MIARPPTRTPVPHASGAIALVLLAVGLAACGSQAAASRCTPTKAVAAKTVPALQRRFDVAELSYECRGSLGSIDFDSVRIALAATTDYPSAHRLEAAVRDDLRGAGWTAPAGSERLTLRRAKTSYAATVTANSISPALAILTLRNTRPSLDAGDEQVDGAPPEKRLTSAAKRRYVTVNMFVARFVPPGYSAWGRSSVVDYDDAGSTLIGGRGEVKPQLRTTAVGPGWSTRECDAFTARTDGDRCVLWATTPAGIKVYLARDTVYPDGLAATPVAIVDGTLVSLLYGHNHTRVKPAISRADVLRIFDSLRASNTPAKR